MYMLKETYRRVKAEDPTKIIVSAGLSPTGTNDGTAQPDDVYLGWLYEYGLAQYSDAIGVHAPGYGSAPEAELNSDPRFPHPSFYFRRVEQLRDIMVAERRRRASRSGCWSSAGPPIRSTREYSWYAVSPEQQADYVVRAYQYARTNWSPRIGPDVRLEHRRPVLDARRTSSTGGASPTRTARPARPTTRSPTPGTNGTLR